MIEPHKLVDCIACLVLAYLYGPARVASRKYDLEEVGLRIRVRPHMMVSPSSADLGRPRSKAALITAGFPCKPHIRRELIPNHCPAFGPGELQENGTTLCPRERAELLARSMIDRWRAAKRSEPDLLKAPRARSERADSVSDPPVLHRKPFRCISLLRRPGRANKS